MRLSKILKSMISSGGEEFYVDNTLIRGISIDLDDGIKVTPSSAIQEVSGLNITSSDDHTVPNAYITLSVNASFPIESIHWVATGDVEFKDGISSTETISVRKTTAGDSRVVATTVINGIEETYSVLLFWRVPELGVAIIDKPFILNSSGTEIKSTPFSGVGTFKNMMYSFAEIGDDTFASPVLTVMSNESETIPLQNTIDGGNYILRIRYFDTDGNASAWSTTVPFLFKFPSNLFSDYPCEYDYFNHYNSHNILKDTTVGTMDGAFSIIEDLSEVKAYAGIAVTKSKVYLVGGHNGDGWNGTILSADIGVDGELSAFTYNGTLSETRGAGSVLVTKSRIYVLGGYNGSAYTTSILSAPIDENGVRGPFEPDGDLSENKAYAQMVVTKSRVYLISGYNGSSYVSTIISAPIDENGVLGSFSSDGATNVIKSRATTILTKTRVYLMSGYDGSSYVTTSISAPINEDGTLGDFVNDGGLPEVKYGATSIVTKSKVFIFGGYNGSAYGNTVVSADITNDGIIGPFESDGTLPEYKTYAQMVVTKTKAYILGGYASSSYSSSVLSAPFADGWEIQNNTYSSLI